MEYTALYISSNFRPHKNHSKAPLYVERGFIDTVLTLDSMNTKWRSGLPPSFPFLHFYPPIPAKKKEEREKTAELNRQQKKKKHPNKTLLLLTGIALWCYTSRSSDKAYDGRWRKLLAVNRREGFHMDKRALL